VCFNHELLPFFMSLKYLVGGSTRWLTHHSRVHLSRNWYIASLYKLFFSFVLLLSEIRELGDHSNNPCVSCVIQVVQVAWSVLLTLWGCRPGRYWDGLLWKLVGVMSFFNFRNELINSFARNAVTIIDPFAYIVYIYLCLVK
jgi:hypothetical protein